MRSYDEIAERVAAACKELNKALEEAFDRADMNVFIRETGGVLRDGAPTRYEYFICRPTHTTLTLKFEKHKVG